MKKIIIVTFALAFASLAQADVLYWMVSDEYAIQADSGSSDPYACLWATDSNGNYKLVDSKTGAQVSTAYNYSDVFYSDLGNYASNIYSFYIELSNGYRTEAVNYTQLSRYIAANGLSIPSTVLASGAFGSNATYAIPEPTSGLLFLLGGMLLGLKRRRQV